ncbi:DNA adenine methylase [Clostridium tagluense]|nr:Dam family site-specific DNA-(adenine-N6)-methyltransferase [Clostridium tagluense]
MNSPIKWVGGKRNIKKLLVSLLPNNYQYVEVFGGAGWVLLDKEPSKIEVLNDINSDLINFYKVVKDKSKCDKLIEDLQTTLKSRELFNEYDLIYQTKQYESDIQQAKIFYYLLKLSFGGRINRNKNSFAIRNDGIKMINYDKFMAEFLELNERLQNVFIENADWEYILNKYDRKDGKGIFFLDPPYLETTEDDYNTTWNIESYVKLHSKLSNLKDRFILTCNDKPQLRELFKEFNIMDNQVHYSVCGTSDACKKYSELIITNYKIEDISKVS